MEVIATFKIQFSRINIDDEIWINKALPFVNLSRDDPISSPDLSMKCLHITPALLAYRSVPVYAYLHRRRYLINHDIVGAFSGHGKASCAF